MKTKTLIKVLESSIQKHGPQYTPTLSHLVNLIKMAERIDRQERERREEEEIILENRFNIDNQ